MRKHQSSKYYDSLLEREKIRGGSFQLEQIRTDVALIWDLFVKLFLFIILFIPNLLGLFFGMLTFNSQQIGKFSNRIFLAPFRGFLYISGWFFEAPVTAYLILFLIFIFFLQVFFLGPYLTNLMTYQLHFAQGNYYSIFTSIFLHGGFVHLFSNCLALLIFGRIVEKQVGLKVLFLFLASGMIANVISNFISYRMGDLYYSLGASGGIAGLIMFAILFSPFSFTSVFILPLPIFVVGWGLILLDIIGLTSASQTNHFAHLGGYSALLVLFFFLEIRHKKKIIAGFVLNVLIIIVIITLIKIFGISIANPLT